MILNAFFIMTLIPLLSKHALKVKVKIKFKLIQTLLKDNKVHGKKFHDRNNNDPMHEITNK